MLVCVGVLFVMYCVVQVMPVSIVVDGAANGTKLSLVAIAGAGLIVVAFVVLMVPEGGLLRLWRSWVKDMKPPSPTTVALSPFTASDSE